MPDYTPEPGMTAIAWPGPLPGLDDWLARVGGRRESIRRTPAWSARAGLLPEASGGGMQDVLVVPLQPSPPERP